jgi:hypothetical protein
MSTTGNSAYERRARNLQAKELAKYADLPDVSAVVRVARGRLFKYYVLIPFRTRWANRPGDCMHGNPAWVYVHYCIGKNCAIFVTEL